jgi:hypothetical protein
MQHLLSPERSFEVIEGQVWISLKPDDARETGAAQAQ